MTRWRGLLDYLAEKPLTWETRYACYQKTNLLNCAHKTEIPAHIRVSFPKAFFDKIKESYGEERALELCRISNTQAPITVRANILKTTREELLQKWKERYTVAPTLRSPWGIRFSRRINFFEMEEFTAGLFEVQDEGSQLVADLMQVEPRQHALDYCAGSGGKTLGFAPKMENKGIIYLHDIRPHALEESKKRLRRAGVQNAQILYPADPAAHKLKGTMDWVLVDAPCSGTGTLRRNPDMKWRFDPSKLAPLLEEQREIFKKALEYLKPDGKIVYATCSILPDENEEQVAYFERVFQLALAEPLLVTFPEEGGMDGFFAAVLKRRI